MNSFLPLPIINYYYSLFKLSFQQSEIKAHYYTGLAIQILAWGGLVCGYCWLMVTWFLDKWKNSIEIYFPPTNHGNGCLTEI